MADFHQFLMILFMEFINIGPAYIRGGGRDTGKGWVVGKALIKKQDDTNSRVWSSYDM